MRLALELPNAAITECGKKLGLYRQGTMVFRDQDEVPVLYDYALNHFRRGGKNAFERYRLLSPPQGSIESEVLEATLSAYYSVFMVTERHDGSGVTLHDVLRDVPILVMDIGLGQTAPPGQFIAGHMLPMAEFRMFSGAAIPLSESLFENIVAPILRKFLKHAKDEASGRLFSPSQEAAFAAQVIRAALQAGALELERDIDTRD
jgi:hypothetical protein